MVRRLFILAPTVLILGMLSACVSGTHHADTYKSRDGSVTVIESDHEMCLHACNSTYERCMETKAASDNSGVNGPSGMFGASGDCRNDLQRCLSSCKAQ